MNTNKTSNELLSVHTKLTFQNKKKAKRVIELVGVTKELSLQDEENKKLTAELTVAYKKIKKGENAILELNKELEEKTIEHTAQLEAVNHELAVQKEAVTKELESFTYSISHDLRAPLRAVSGYARILKENCEKVFNPESNRLMSNIIINAKKMGQLIDELVAFSRLGWKELVKRDISMQEMVTNICGDIKAKQSKDPIEFKINKLLPVVGDSLTIKQVWGHLVSNAVKFSKLNEKTIVEIGSKIRGDNIVYSIKDNGVGFDMQYTSKLFGVFQRLHSNEAFEGNGIGLAIAQRIIHKHGGKIWAEAKVNEGATFFFSLPYNIPS